MEKDGGIYVSDTASKEQFLRLKLDGQRPDLSQAIEIFRSRITGRYLSQINKLNKDAFHNGFASMALCCLLIDTFYQFEHGVKKTTKNHDCYVRFLREHFGDVFDTQEKADRFYVDIRCGILHSAQTTNGSQLSCDQGTVITILNSSIDSPIRVDVKMMETRLNVYFNEYCNRLHYDKTTQSNFVKKLKLMFN